MKSKDYKFKKRLKKIISDLKPYNPEKVILFGSFAKGKARENSDIDLLVVKKTKKNRSQRTEEVLDLIYKEKDFGKGIYDIPVEFHVYTPKELNQRLSMGDFFVEEVLNTGKVIHEKK